MLIHVEPVTAARARTRACNGLNGRSQDEGIVDPGRAHPRRQRQRCTLRLHPARSLASDRFFDRFGKNGREGGRGRIDRCCSRCCFLEKCGKPMTHSLFRHAVGPFALDTMTFLSLSLFSSLPKLSLLVPLRLRHVEEAAVEDIEEHVAINKCRDKMRAR